MDGALSDEVYQTPSELLAVCRDVGPFNWKIADIEAEGSSASKEKRAEAAALGRYCEIYKGSTFSVRIEERPATDNRPAKYVELRVKLKRPRLGAEI